MRIHHAELFIACHFAFCMGFLVGVWFVSYYLTERE